MEKELKKGVKRRDWKKIEEKERKLEKARYNTRIKEREVNREE